MDATKTFVTLTCDKRKCRPLSIPDGVKSYIIPETNFTKGFEEMIKMLMLDYDGYVNAIFKQCRTMPFPTPHYPDRELIKSFVRLQTVRVDIPPYNNISINSRMGDRLINHFHESIYSAHRKGKISPYDAWYNDELLMKCIKNRIIFQTQVNPNKILQGFNVSRIAPKVSVFSASRAKLIIDKYLEEFDTIFDPFSGFSGRMLGAVSLGKRYIGQDISQIHVNESNKLLRFLRESKLNVSAQVRRVDIFNDDGTYDCLFTCPPYGDKEQWIDCPVTAALCDEWIDECLKRYHCRRYVFVVDHSEKYTNYIKEEILSKSHYNNTSEYLIVIDR